jgi:thiamine-monophosphate kinase
MSAVSDVAAMGGVIRYLLIAVTAPAGSDLESLHQGISQAAREAGASVVGGDLSAGPALQVAVTVIGETPSSGALLRSGAAAGDVLFVTGPLGRAAAGLRRRREGVGAADELVRAQSRPVARLAEGMAAGRAGVSAAMDLSDGLAIDLHRLADASSVGFTLTHLPVASGATEVEALSGGEDYELLIATSDPERLRREFEISQLPTPIEIGRVIGEGHRTLDGRGFPREGWQHEF